MAKAGSSKSGSGKHMMPGMPPKSMPNKMMKMPPDMPPKKMPGKAMHSGSGKIMSKGKK